MLVFIMSLPTQGTVSNELVDVAAKMEMKKSFNLPRQRLCMQEWIPKISPALDSIWRQSRTAAMV